MAVAIFNDPGVYVVEEIIPVPAEPEIPTQPAAYIGPLFNVVDQEPVTTTETTIKTAIEDQTDLTVQYPNMKDSNNPIDTDSVKVELIKPDGRRAEIPETDGSGDTLLTINPSDISISVYDDTNSEYYQFFKDLNDAWLGMKVDYSAADPDWSGIKDALVHVNYRAVREDLVGRVLEAQGPIGTQLRLGKASLENPLGLMGGIASSVAPDTAAYYVPTKDYLTGIGDSGGTIDEQTEISQATERLAPIRAYGVTALTSDEQSHQIVTNHVNSMSEPEDKMFRVNWSYKPLPTEQEVRDFKNLDAGSELTEMDLKQGQVDILSQYATAVSNKRTICLYNDFTIEIDGEERELPGYYLAGAYAALKSTIAPQQGLTNYPMDGVAKKLKYQKGYFKPSQLKELSSAGMFVCTQNVESAPVTSRAQWTTNTLNNKTKQTSIRYCVDYFKWTLIDTLDPLIGVRNVTDASIREIRETIENLIDEMRNAGIIIEAEIQQIIQNPDNASQVDVTLQATFPSPLDQIVITLKY